MSNDIYLILAGQFLQNLKTEFKVLSGTDMIGDPNLLGQLDEKGYFLYFLTGGKLADLFYREQCRTVQVVIGESELVNQGWPFGSAAGNYSSPAKMVFSGSCRI